MARGRRSFVWDDVNALVNCTLLVAGVLGLLLVVVGFVRWWVS